VQEASGDTQGDQDSRGTGEGDDTLDGVTTVSALDYFEPYRELERLANAYAPMDSTFADIWDDKKLAKTAEVRFKERLASLFRPAAAEYGHDAKSIVDEARSMTFFNLGEQQHENSGPPIDLHLMLESSIRPWMKSDRSSQAPQTASSLEHGPLTLNLR
jgi:hypothetical protein